MKTNETAIRQKLEGLVADCEAWETNELSSSNDILYDLLTRCYELYQDIRGQSTKIKVVEVMVKARKINTQANTPLMTKIVKIVFGPERKRASTYSLALRAAQEQKIAPGKLRDYFVDAGGVEEVRLQASGAESSSVRREMRVDLAVDALKLATPLATIPKSDDTPKPDVDDTNQYVVLLGEITVNGEVKVLQFVPDKALKTHALRVAGVVLEKSQKFAEDSKAQVSKQQVKRDAVEAAAADAASVEADHRQAA